MDIEAAKEYLMEKGKKFIASFYQYVLHRLDASIALESMQVIWKEVFALEILDVDGHPRIVTNVQLVFWFFMAGTNPNGVIDMPDEDIGYAYDRFLLVLLSDRAQGRYPSVENAVKCFK